MVPWQLGAWLLYMIGDRQEIDYPETLVAFEVIEVYFTYIMVDRSEKLIRNRLVSF
jgi:hypothetical protein